MRDKTQKLLAEFATKSLEHFDGDIEGARSEFRSQLRDYYDGDSEEGSFAAFTKDAFEIFMEAERLYTNQENENLVGAS